MLPHISSFLISALLLLHNEDVVREIQRIAIGRYGEGAHGPEQVFAFEVVLAILRFSLGSTKVVSTGFHDALTLLQHHGSILVRPLPTQQTINSGFVNHSIERFIWILQVADIHSVPGQFWSFFDVFLVHVFDNIR